MQCRTCIGALGTPQPNGAPRQKVFTGFPLQLIFAKVKAENQQHLLHHYLQISQHSTRRALHCRSFLYYKDSQPLDGFINGNSKIISFKEFISPQPVGGSSKRKNPGPWARAQCAHWLRRPCIYAEYRVQCKEDITVRLAFVFMCFHTSVTCNSIFFDMSFRAFLDRPRLCLCLGSCCNIV